MATAYDENIEVQLRGLHWVNDRSSDCGLLIAGDAES
jgi:hypothetical protein